jgi:hypothetical protein
MSNIINRITKKEISIESKMLLAAIIQQSKYAKFCSGKVKKKIKNRSSTQNSS